MNDVMGCDDVIIHCTTFPFLVQFYFSEFLPEQLSPRRFNNFPLNLTPTFLTSTSTNCFSLPSFLSSLKSPRHRGPGWSVGSITRWRNTFTSSGAERQLSQMEQIENRKQNSELPNQYLSHFLSFIQIFSIFILPLLFPALHSPFSMPPVPPPSL